MIIDTFTDPVLARAFRIECASWIPTPFRQGCAIKGRSGGVDCVHYVASCLKAIGQITDEVEIPSYDPEHGDHSPHSLLLEWFANPAVAARVRKVEDGEPTLPGDLVMIKTGLCEHHMGIRFGGDVFHVVRGVGVIIQPIYLKTRPLQVRCTYRLINTL
jgi:hypothetical protein